MKSSLFQQALILVCLAFLPAIGETIYFREKISWQDPKTTELMVSVDKARGWGADAIWVDARLDQEFEQEHVPGAIQLNEDHWNDLLPGLLAQWSPDKKVVVYCSTESCNLAVEVAARLRNEAQLKDAAGQETVFVLDGGWEEWLKTRK